MKTYSLRPFPAGGWMVFANESETPVLLIESSTDLAIFRATLAPIYGEPIPEALGADVQLTGDADA